MSPEGYPQSPKLPNGLPLLRLRSMTHTCTVRGLGSHTPFSAEDTFFGGYDRHRRCVGSRSDNTSARPVWEGFCGRQESPRPTRIRDESRRPSETQAESGVCNDWHKGGNVPGTSLLYFESGLVGY